MLLAVAGVLVLWCGSAQATLTHRFVSSFGSFASVQGVAVESGSGTVYVYDGGAGSVYKFDASGSPVSFTATGTNAIGAGFAFSAEGEIAVDNSSGPAKGDIYVAHADGSIEIFSATGSKLGELTEGSGDPWGEACGVAVDASGAVYVGLYGSHVNEYVPSANPVTNADYVSSLAGLNGICNVGADSTGNVFADTWSSGPVRRYEPGQFGSSSATGSEVDSKGSTLAVDPANDELYVDERDQVAQYGPHGEPFNAPVLTFAGSGQGAISGSLGVAVSGFNHDVYVSDGSGQISMFGPAVMLPTVVTGGASKLSPETATVTGTVNPEGLPVSECFFEYGESTAYGNIVPCQESSGEIGSGSSPVSVHTTLTGLASGVTYHYRLVAANSNGPAAGEDAEYEFGPVISEEYATDVTATSATFHAQVNPMGNDTTYRFEYGPSTSYGSNTPEMDVGAGLTSQPVRFHAQDLQAGSVYHYRLVATNSLGTTHGLDQTLTTQTIGRELTLLDGRQWELVTPPNKQGATISAIAEVGVVQAADDGRAITYVANAPTEVEPQGNTTRVQVLSRRGTAGWSSQDIATPHSEATGPSIGVGYEYRFFSPDLSLALVEPQGSFVPLSAEATERTLYIRKNAECLESPSTCYAPLVTASNVAPGTEFGGNGSFLSDVRFEGGTQDLSHVVLSSSVGLTSTPGDEGGLYEWAAGQLSVVSALPESEGETPLKYASLGYLRGDGKATRNAISNDGSRVFWSPNSSTSRKLYLRDVARGETVRVGSGNAFFQMANAAGSRVFFSSGSEEGPLEVCDIVEAGGKLACELSQLAPSMPGGVIEASEDGSYVYFVSNARLASGAVSGTCESFGRGDTSDLCNLYVAHDNGTGWESPKLIGVLSAADSPDWSTNRGGLAGITARVSPDGHRLAFMSRRSLTGYDNRDANSGESDEEVYLYDASTERLSCASCDPTGARPLGRTFGEGVWGGQDGKGILGGGDGVWKPEAWLAANIPGWTAFELGGALYQSRYLSGSGRLFFNSGDALVPQDVNGTWDVYEYEPPGVGSCTTSSATYSPHSEGCVDLVSSGSSPDQSAFLDASGKGPGGQEGEDVFFLTTSHLATQDFDTSYDVYDAHVCSADAPCTPPVASPPPCDTGDSCKASPSPQPSIYGAPASSTFAGTGNVVASPPRPVTGRSLTRVQRLRRALRACQKKKDAHKRRSCERRTRRRYGAKHAHKAKATRRGSR